MNMLYIIRTGELIVSRACALTHSMYNIYTHENIYMYMYVMAVESIYTPKVFVRQKCTEYV